MVRFPAVSSVGSWCLVSQSGSRLFAMLESHRPSLLKSSLFSYSNSISIMKRI